MVKNSSYIDNTFFYIIILLTVLLGLGLFKVFVTLSLVDNKIEFLTEKVEKDNNQDPGTSGVTLEEKIAEHLDSLSKEEILESIEEIDGE